MYAVFTTGCILCPQMYGEEPEVIRVDSSGGRGTAAARDHHKKDKKHRSKSLEQGGHGTTIISGGSPLKRRDSMAKKDRWWRCLS